jgi:hypothetical protein
MANAEIIPINGYVKPFCLNCIVRFDRVPSKLLII